MWHFYVAVVIYALTIQFGVVGNSWVICSVIRNRRPYNSVTRRSPSDRLRNYIFVLAVVDFIVIITLLVRLLYLCLQKTFLELATCQVIFFTEHFAKLASLSCIACISAERFIAIKKPFDSQVRKYLFKLTPYITCCALLINFTAMILQITTVNTTPDHLECRLSPAMNNEKIVEKILIILICFSLIVFVSANYGQIILHVRRKFWKRKARVPLDSHGQKRIITEPRYMKEMTSAILRVAIFHLLCWLPFCVFQILPNEVSTLTAASLRLFKKGKNDQKIALHWIAFFVNWLVYASSAANWIFYAVMNRDLRTLIRRNTERRKRSNMSQPSPPGRVSSSFRNHISNGFRFLHGSSTRSQSSGVDDRSPLHLAVPTMINGFNPTTKRKSQSEFDIRRGLLGRLLNTPQHKSATSSKRNSILCEILIQVQN